MRNKEAKAATIRDIGQMICHADQGPSGFWVDDGKGCGNPGVFPEFEDGLKRGRLVQREHYLCPWNTAVMYGNGHGNLQTGCYCSCSLDQAKYLTTSELIAVLKRFRTYLANGAYDNLDKLSPLLTDKEIQILEQRAREQKSAREKQAEDIRRKRLRAAAHLTAKYPDAEGLLASYYGENVCAIEGKGLIVFGPNSQKDVVGAQKMTYNQYLDVQFSSLGCKCRWGFAQAFSGSLFELKGKIEKISKKYICFQKIRICGIRMDGQMFDEKEDHVWMEKAGFEEFCVGDCVCFSAEVYRYIKTGNGKQIDYGLRNPTDIHRVKEYSLPSDYKLAKQEVDQFICENCCFTDHCDRNFCMLGPSQRVNVQKLTRNVVLGNKVKG